MGAGIAVHATEGGVLVTLRNSEVSDNRATTVGGGVLLLSGAGSASLDAADNVRMKLNFAREGGGAVAMNGGSRLMMVSHGLQVEANGALGDGGAVLAVSPATIHLGASPIPGTAGTFVGNEARNGGVLALTDHPRLGASSGRSIVTIASDDFANPQVLAFNRAHQRGGVVWIQRPQPPAVPDHVSRVCSWNVAMDSNDAAFGGSVAAIAGEAAIYRNDADCSLVPALCPGDACNRVSFNVATVEDGQPSAAGSVFDVRDGAQMHLRGLRLRQNTAIDLFRMSNLADVPTAGLEVYQALVSANTLHSVLQQCDRCYFQMSRATVAGNAFSGPVFRDDVRNFYFYDSIVDQPGSTLFAIDPLQFGGSPVANILYSADYVAGYPLMWFGVPSFFDAEAGDYRLKADSPGIDAVAASDDVDLYGRERSVDIPWRPDLSGPRDLGAIETQADEASDTLFADGFDPQT
jgi:hypothetical protein